MVCLRLALVELAALGDIETQNDSSAASGRFTDLLSNA